MTEAPRRIDEATVPRLAPGVRLREDKVRDQWTLVAPERMFVLDEIALEILRACDGKNPIGTIADDFAKRFDAPRDEILADISEMLQGFWEKGVIKG